MSSLSGTQIPKPSDEQAFERACVPLWCGLLKPAPFIAAEVVGAVAGLGPNTEVLA